MKIKKGDLFMISTLLILSLLLWKHIPSLQFQGEGFYYFAKIGQEINLSFVIDLIQNFQIHHDAFALLFFNIIGPIFKDQVHLYMWFMFITMILIDGIFYLMVRITTGSKLVGVIATIFFSLSFIGNYDMYSNGGYHYFLQRGIILLPMLIAFIFLHLYFSSRYKLRYFVISLTFYLFGILMGYFGTWFLAPFIFYPLFQLLFMLNKLLRSKLRSIPFGASLIFVFIPAAELRGILTKNKLKLGFLKRIVWLPFPYIIGNYLIIKNSAYSSGEVSIIEFLVLETESVLSGIIHQLTVITLPVESYKWVSSFVIRTDFILNTTLIFGILLSLLYGIAIKFVVKNRSQWAALVVASFFSLLLMLFLNLYKNSAATLTTTGSSRYFYYPFSMVALFWGLVISTVLLKAKKPWYKLMVFSVVPIWAFYNQNAIKSAIEADEPHHIANYETVRYLREWAPYLKENTSYVILSSNVGAYGGEFALRYFINKDSFIGIEGLHQIDYNELAAKGVDPSSLFVLHYDQPTQKVINETDRWRQFLRDLRETRNEE